MDKGSFFIHLHSMISLYLVKSWLQHTSLQDANRFLANRWRVVLNYQKSPVTFNYYIISGCAKWPMSMELMGGNMPLTRKLYQINIHAIWFHDSWLLIILAHSDVEQTTVSIVRPRENVWRVLSYEYYMNKAFV